LKWSLDPPEENPTFKNTQVQVVGISGDSVEKQKAFVQRNHLTVSLGFVCREPSQLTTTILCSILSSATSRAKLVKLTKFVVVHSVQHTGEQLLSLIVKASFGAFVSDSVLPAMLIHRRSSDRCDNGVSYSAHHRFVEEWLVKLEAEQNGE
jgi:hypothetical protein